MDTEGNVLVVWGNDWDGMWANAYRQNGGWSGAVKFDEARNIASPDPIIAGNPETGKAVVIRTGFYNLQNTIYVVQYDPLSGWGPGETVFTQRFVQVSKPSVALDAADNILVAWYGTAAVDGDVQPGFWWSLYQVGVGWSVPERLRHGSEAGLENATLYTLRNGSIAVTYQSAGGFWFRRFDAMTGWQAAEQLDSGSTGNITFSDLVSENDGTIQLIWGRDQDLSMSRYTEAAGWSQPDKFQLFEQSNRPMIMRLIGQNRLLMVRQKRIGVTDASPGSMLIEGEVRTIP